MRNDKYILLLNLKKDLSQEQRKDKRDFYKNQKLVSKIKSENLLSLNKSLSSITYLISETKLRILDRTKVLFIIEKLMKKVKIKVDYTSFGEEIDTKYKEEINYLVNLLNKIED